MPEEKPTLDHDHLPTKLGTEFFTKFFRLLKGTAIYDRKNVIIDRLTQECVQVINNIVRSEGNLFLKIVRDNFFFNNIRIIVSADKFPIFKAFWQDMRKRWIGEVEFSEEVNAEHLKDFIYLLSGLEENNESNYLYVKKQLEYRNIESIEVGKLEFYKDEEIYADSEGQKRYSKEFYFNAIGLVKEVVDGIHQQKALNIRKAKRLMQNAVTGIRRDVSTFLGWATLKNYDEYTSNHSLNVAIYAIALGQRIGIPQKHLSHLGMAGFFPFIGRREIPDRVV